MLFLEKFTCPLGRISFLTGTVDLFDELKFITKSFSLPTHKQSSLLVLDDLVLSAGIEPAS